MSISCGWWFWSQYVKSWCPYACPKVPSSPSIFGGSFYHRPWWWYSVEGQARCLAVCVHRRECCCRTGQAGRCFVWRICLATRQIFACWREREQLIFGDHWHNTNGVVHMCALASRCTCGLEHNWISRRAFLEEERGSLGWPCSKSVSEARQCDLVVMLWYC